ncbi:hypothetical protein O3G_MSEX012599 [Manduca sexta]|uniref:Uncharacterized protein n=1 Tax=Manduca sexta TaxID=7130 RepID=A0A921ZPL0_MANSE|nr:hypothetical protein O3G_MSEX012599 [Manduca sexta]
MFFNYPKNENKKYMMLYFIRLDNERQIVDPLPSTSQHASGTTLEEVPEDLLPDEVSPEVIAMPVPELDPQLLEALGDATDDTPIYGPDIHTSLAQRWLPILKKGIQAEAKTKLLKEYTIPDNCKLLKAPTLNAEISAAVTDLVRNRDKKLQAKQDQLGLGIAAINKAMSLLLTCDDKVQVTKMLSDGCRLLTDLHFNETQVRTKLVTPGLDKAFLSLIQDQDRDETLFGNKLPEKIRASKAIEKQGLQIKKVTNPKSSSSTVTRFQNQGNWSVPPRYPPSKRGGHTSTYRTTAQQHYRRPPPAPLPTHPKRSSARASSNKRVPARQ